MSFPVDIIFAHPDCGWEWESRKAVQYGLEPGETYIIRKMEVGQSDTRIWLLDHPGPDAGFSSVLFEPAPDKPDPDDPRVECDLTGLTVVERSEIRAALSRLHIRADRFQSFLHPGFGRGSAVLELNQLMHVARQARDRLEKNWQQEQER